MGADYSVDAAGEDLQSPALNKNGTVSRVLYPIGGEGKSGYTNRAKRFGCYLDQGGIDTFFLEYSYTQESVTLYYVATIKVGGGILL